MKSAILVQLWCNILHVWLHLYAVSHPVTSLVAVLIPPAILTVRRHPLVVVQPSGQVREEDEVGLRHPELEQRLVLVELLFGAAIGAVGPVASATGLAARRRKGRLWFVIVSGTAGLRWQLKPFEVTKVQVNSC